jgi:hypothetical protein
MVRHSFEGTAPTLVRSEAPEPQSGASSLEVSKEATVKVGTLSWSSEGFGDCITNGQAKWLSRLEADDLGGACTVVVLRECSQRAFGR